MGFCRKINNRSVVLECLYLDHPADTLKLLNNGHEKIADGIVNGILELYGKQKIIYQKSLQDKIRELQVEVVRLAKMLIEKIWK